MTIATHRGVDGELRTAAGLIVPTPEAPLRAWVKLAGEPPQVLYESPQEFIRLWREFQASDETMLICHDHAYGQAMAFMRNAQISFVGVTYPTTSQGRTTPGSIWAGQCQCGSFGGRCPDPR